MARGMAKRAMTAVRRWAAGSGSRRSAWRARGWGSRFTRHLQPPWLHPHSTRLETTRHHVRHPPALLQCRCLGLHLLCLLLPHPALPPLIRAAPFARVRTSVRLCQARVRERPRIAQHAPCRACQVSRSLPNFVISGPSPITTRRSSVIPQPTSIQGAGSPFLFSFPAPDPSPRPSSRKCLPNQTPPRGPRRPLLPSLVVVTPMARSLSPSCGRQPSWPSLASPPPSRSLASPRSMEVSRRPYGTKRPLCSLL